MTILRSNWGFKTGDAWNLSVPRESADFAGHSRRNRIRRHQNGDQGNNDVLFVRCSWQFGALSKTAASTASRYRRAWRLHGPIQMHQISHTISLDWPMVWSFLRTISRDRFGSCCVNSEFLASVLFGMRAENKIIVNPQMRSRTKWSLVSTDNIDFGLGQWRVIDEWQEWTKPTRCARDGRSGGLFRRTLLWVATSWPDF